MILDAIKAGLNRPFRYIDVLKSTRHNLWLLKTIRSDIIRYTLKVMDEPTFDAAQMQLADSADALPLEFRQVPKMWLDDQRQDYKAYIHQASQSDEASRKLRDSHPCDEIMELPLFGSSYQVDAGRTRSQLDAHTEEFSLPFGKVVSKTRTQLMQSKAIGRVDEVDANDLEKLLDGPRKCLVNPRSSISSIRWFLSATRRGGTEVQVE